MDTINKIQELNLWYIPIIAFVLILFLGLLIGAVNGWKGALYFLVWHWVAALALTFGMQALFSSITEEIIGSFNLSANVSKVLVENKILLANLLTVLSIIAGLLIIDLIAFLIYLIFRPKLKRTIKETKAIEESNFGTRIFGAGIGLISALPMAASVAGITTTFSRNKEISSVFSQITKYSTFGVVDNIYDDARSILAALVSRELVLELFDNLAYYEDTKIEDSEIIYANDKKKNKDMIQEILAYEGSVELLKDFLKEFVPENPNQNIILKSKNINDIINIFHSFSDPLALDSKQEENLTDILSYFFPTQRDGVIQIVQGLENLTS